MKNRLRLAILALCVLAPLLVQAQAVNYIDESGTVHFADSLQQVPLKYRSQLIKPTPGPRTEDEYRRQMTDYKKKQADEEREQKQALREADKERQRKEREKQKLTKMKKKDIEAELRRREKDQGRMAEDAKREAMREGMEP